MSEPMNTPERIPLGYGCVAVSDKDESTGDLWDVLGKDGRWLLSIRTGATRMEAFAAAMQPPASHSADARDLEVHLDPCNCGKCVAIEDWTAAAMKAALSSRESPASSDAVEALRAIQSNGGCFFSEAEQAYVLRTIQVYGDARVAAATIQVREFLDVEGYGHKIVTALKDKGVEWDGVAFDALASDISSAINHALAAHTAAKDAEIARLTAALEKMCACQIHRHAERPHGWRITDLNLAALEANKVLADPAQTVGEVAV